MTQWAEKYLFDRIHFELKLLGIVVFIPLED